MDNNSVNDKELLQPHVTYELEKPVEDLEHWRLLVNGTPTICPFQTVHAIPGRDDINFLKQPCTTECPLVNVTQEGDIYKYQIGCSAVDRTVTATLKAKEKIIKLKSIITPE